MNNGRLGITLCKNTHFFENKMSIDYILESAELIGISQFVSSSFFVQVCFTSYSPIKSTSRYIIIVYFFFIFFFILKCYLKILFSILEFAIVDMVVKMLVII